MLNDLRFVLRGLSRAPFHAMGMVLILALGLGVNLALGAFAHRLLLHPFDAPEPDRVMAVQRQREGAHHPFSAHDFLALQAQGGPFSHLAATAGRSALLEQDGEVRRVQVLRCSASFLPIFGLPATFPTEADRASGHSLAVVTHAFWTARLGADPGAGDAERIPALGVTGAYFQVLRPRMALGRGLASADEHGPRGNLLFQGVARPKEGAPIAQAQIDPSVQNGTVTPDASIDETLPKGARPDLSVEGVIKLDRADRALQVGHPVQAQSFGTLSHFRLGPDGKEATRVKVKLDRASISAVARLEGLKEGDQVILPTPRSTTPWIASA